MIHNLKQTARKLVAGSMAAAVGMLTLSGHLPGAPQARDMESTKTRVRELHANGSEAQIKLSDGTKVQGEILGIQADSFTIREEKTAREVTLQFTQVSQVKKKGLSRGSKAVLIPAIIGGAALLVLCAAPYPIGFLCRKDPS